ncbi:MAG: L,D-transpeptidase [Verrucomicrobiales bacterium]|nr:L,D-transpeptidase [Verrucomicrobiales bacterium]
MKNSHSSPFRHLLGALSAGALLLAAAGCKSGPSGHATSDKFDPVAYRPRNPAAVSVKLSTSAQRVYVMEGSRVLLATPCSVGTPGDPTPHGHFRIYRKEANRRRQSEPDRGYPMAYWMEFKPAYGLHWGFVKPYPCTHGCVRLPMKSAAKIFAMVPAGAPLHIASSHPEDATAGRSLPVLDDGPLPNPPQSYLHSPRFFEDARYKGRMFVD